MLPLSFFGETDGELVVANQTCSEVSMRGDPCPPNHQKESAPKTAKGWSGLAVVPQGVRTSVEGMG